MGLALGLIVWNGMALSWTKQAAIGYGYGREIGEDYDNHGVMLSGKFYKMQIDQTLIATIDGSVSSWHADTSSHSSLTTAAAYIGFRGYFVDPAKHDTRPYLGVSLGPAYLSSPYFGTRRQGSHAAMQATLEAGTEIQQVDLNLRLVHYCNGGVADNNEAFNIPFVFSIGYLMS